MPAPKRADEAAISADKRRRGQRAFGAGAAAEEAVARHYAAQGMAIAECRWRGHGGEIDLIVRNGAGLVFVEVKQGRTHHAAAERLAARQMDRILAAAAEYLGRMPRGQLTEARFDLALVDRVGRVQILENAFGH